MKNIKFTVSNKRPERSLIKLLKQYEELKKQGVHGVHLVVYNGVTYIHMEWMYIHSDSPRSLIKGIESLLDRMFLSRLVTYRQCHRVDIAIGSLWECY